MFHRWMGTDDARTDTCIGCGVHTPDYGSGVMSDHGPLPLWCPAPQPEWPHYLQPAVPGSGESVALECEWCGARVTDLTLPDTFGWECRQHPGEEES
jgi:hypothetical protein